MSQFQKDLIEAHKAEQIVLDILSSLAPGYTFEDVSNDSKYYHKGDLKAVDGNGKEIMIEVKDDSRIHQTQNILCEEENYFLEAGYFQKGNFYSDYEIYCVLSQENRKLYVFDFSVLKSIYKRGQFMEIKHPQNICYCYLLPIATAKKCGGLIREIDY